jgi:hypothetical protein
MTYRCISADSHLEIRPDRYVKRVAAKYRDRAPKVITLEDGTLAVLQEGQPLERLISNISCGLAYEARRPFDPIPGENYENSPGTGSPEQRLREQDQDVLMPKYCSQATSAQVFGAASETTTPTKRS